MDPAAPAGFFARLAALLQARGSRALLALGLVSLVALALAPRIRFDFTPQALFRGSDDLVDTAEEFKATFGHDDAVILCVLEAEAAGATVISVPALTWQDDLAYALTEERPSARIERVTTLAGLSVPIITEPRPIRLGMQPLLPYEIEEADLGRVRAALDKSDDLRRRFVSEDRKLLATYIQLPEDARSLEAMREAVEHVEAVLAETVKVPPGFRAQLSGLPALRVGIVSDLQKDQFQLLPITALLFVVILIVLFRSPVWGLLPLIAVGLGLAWTVAVLVVADRPFNLVTNILPLLLFILGTTNAVHIVARYGEERRRNPDRDRAEAARDTIRHLGLACLLTALTTAAGFLALVVSRTSVLRDLAWEAAVGIGLIYVATIVLLGALLHRFRAPWVAGTGEPRPVTAVARSLTTRALDRLASFVLARPGWILAGGLALVGAGLYSARSVEVNSYMLETYDEDHPETLLIRDLERRLGGFVSLDVYLRAEGAEEAPFLNAERFGAALALGRFAQGYDEVLDVTSYATVLDAIRTGPLGAAGGAEAGAATTGDVVEAYAAVERIAEETGLRRYLTEDGQRARLQLRVKDAGTQRTLRLLEGLERRAAELWPEGSGVTVALTGDATLNCRAMNGFVRDLGSSLLLATALIFGLMTLLLRSVRAGLTAALPNLTPLILTVGYMGAFGYDMNVGNAIVFTISLGVAVDDTVHFLARAYEELSAGSTIDEAIRAAVVGAGRAMVLTSILLVSGLSVLLFSDFVPHRRFAELTSLTMVCALLGDLVLLPACMKLFWRGPSAQQ